MRKSIVLLVVFLFITNIIFISTTVLYKTKMINKYLMYIPLKEKAQI